MIDSPITCARPAFTQIKWTCAKIVGFLEDQARKREVKEKLDPRLEILPTGRLQIVRSLDFGLQLVAQRQAPKNVILQILIEAGLFKAWKKNLGPVSLFYADPYGLELMCKNNSWALWVGDRRFLLSGEYAQSGELIKLLIERGLIYYLDKPFTPPAPTPIQESMSPPLESRILTD